MDLERLRFRARIMQNIRRFFIERGYLELDTPALSCDLIPETCLEVFKTDYIKNAAHAKTAGRTHIQSSALYLVPSPEIYIKKIIAQHKVNVFQLSKCYRNAESCGRIHSPEFTMLEYYTMNADYKTSMDITEQLFDFLTAEQNTSGSTDSGTHSCIQKPFMRLSMDKAFERYAHFRLSKCANVKELAKQARKLGITEPDERPFNTWALADLYDLIFVQTVEPALPKEKALFLTDYPAFVSCLAKDVSVKPKQSKMDKALWKERWELYVQGIELANCYTEEIDTDKIKAYFETEGKLKDKTALVPHRTDSDYWKIFRDFPPCSGVALGVDRLIALLAGSSSIEPILPFPLNL